jgi:DNA-binding NarL/FixJ family response regulator
MPKAGAQLSGKLALIVHADMTVIAGLQSVFSQSGITTIVARDLPTALLAMTQHYFDLAVVSSRISEEGDGWPVGGVLRLVFAKAFVVVIAPETDVLTLKAAINNGIDEIFDKERSPEEIAEAIVAQVAGAVKPAGRVVQ